MTLKPPPSKPRDSADAGGIVVAFEGVDGAGKTTLAPLVAQQLQHQGISATAAAKRAPGIAEPFAAEQLSLVADRLWGVPHDARLDMLGTPYWIYLNAAFFAGTHHALTRELAPGQVVIFDNWINKFIARISTQGRYLADDLLETLSYVPQPDMVIMLDVPPAIAAQRKTEASELERGILHDGHLNFVAYQSLVRDVLLHLAEVHAWTIVPVRDESPDELAAAVSALIQQKLSSQTGIGRSAAEPTAALASPGGVIGAEKSRLPPQDRHRDE